uniref:Uncharacterized protein n=1 Tax=Panagrolaimus sp. JU765 TaxID=591449 RepID=A0AC34RNY1_9BILA
MAPNVAKRRQNILDLDFNDPAVIDFMKQTVERSESYKFIHMADDFHDVARSIDQIKMCFWAMTGAVYLVLIVGAIYYCINRNRRNVSQRRPRSQWEYQMEAQDTRNPGQTEDLVSVRSDGQTGLTTAPSYMRNHRGGPAPSFMRHGLQMNHSSQTTRLVTDNDGTVKHANITSGTTTNNNGS